MWILAAVAVIGVLLTAVLAWEDEHERGFILIIGLLSTLVGTGIAFLITDTLYHRAAFAARTACMAKRQEAVRQALTTNVICVPAYRETKNDTTTVNLNSK